MGQLCSSRCCLQPHLGCCLSNIIRCCGSKLRRRQAGGWTRRVASAIMCRQPEALEHSCLCPGQARVSLRGASRGPRTPCHLASSTSMSTPERDRRERERDATCPFSQQGLSGQICVHVLNLKDCQQAAKHILIPMPHARRHGTSRLLQPSTTVYNRSKGRAVTRVMPLITHSPSDVQPRVNVRGVNGSRKPFQACQLHCTVCQHNVTVEDKGMTREISRAHCCGSASSLPNACLASPALCKQLAGFGLPHHAEVARSLADFFNKVLFKLSVRRIRRYPTEQYMSLPYMAQCSAFQQIHLYFTSKEAAALLRKAGPELLLHRLGAM